MMSCSSWNKSIKQRIKIIPMLLLILASLSACGPYYGKGSLHSLYANDPDYRREQQISDKNLRLLIESYRLIKATYGDEVNIQALVAGAALGMTKAVSVQGTPIRADIQTALEETRKKESADPIQAIDDFFQLICSLPDVDPVGVAHRGVSEMIAALDADGSFHTPEEAKLLLNPDGNVASVGLQITLRDNLIVVLSPIGGTPAEKAGIRKGDRILAIDQQTTEGLNLLDVVKKLKGEEGSQIVLTVKRGNLQPFDVTMTREPVKFKGLMTHKTIDGTGYIRLVSLTEEGSEKLKRALESLSKKGMRSLILGLRDNPGGLFSTAIAVSGLFLEKGQKVASIYGRDKKNGIDYFAEEDYELPPIPMGVLVNKMTASGAEIIAASLQDYGRAVVIGTATFGRSSVQSIIPLSDGSLLRLTTGRFVTQKGRSIQTEGVIPDILMELPDSGGKQMSLGDPESDVQLQKALKLLREKENET